MATPLTGLTCKELTDRENWIATHQTTFEQLKELLIAGLVLQGPDFKKHFMVQCLRLGAVLSQIDQAHGDYPEDFLLLEIAFPRETPYSGIARISEKVGRGGQFFFTSLRYSNNL